MTALENHLLSALERLQDESQKQHNSYLQSVAELQRDVQRDKKRIQRLFDKRQRFNNRSLETLNKLLK